MAKHSVTFKVTAVIDIQVEAPSLADALAATSKMRVPDIIKTVERSGQFVDYGAAEQIGVYNHEGL